MAEVAEKRDTGAGYSGDDDRRAKMRRISKSGGDAKTNHAEDKVSRIQRWILILGLGAVATIGAWIGSYFIKAAQKLDLSKYRPLNGIVIGYNRKPLMATATPEGKLEFYFLNNYSLQTQNYDSYIYYTSRTPVDETEALNAFGAQMVQLENGFMTRVLRPEGTSDIEREQIRTFSIIRQKVREIEKQRD